MILGKVFYFLPCLEKKQEVNKKAYEKVCYIKLELDHILWGKVGSFFLTKKLKEFFQKIMLCCCIKRVLFSHIMV